MKPNNINRIVNTCTYICSLLETIKIDQRLLREIIIDTTCRKPRESGKVYFNDRRCIVKHLKAIVTIHGEKFIDHIYRQGIILERAAPDCITLIETEKFLVIFVIELKAIARKDLIDKFTNFDNFLGYVSTTNRRLYNRIFAVPIIVLTERADRTLVLRRIPLKKFHIKRILKIRGKRPIGISDIIRRYRKALQLLEEIIKCS
ncbi:MAG: hypothetical protein DRN68_04880 [Thaumarchaeota archaeon]|nr:MAG: hypothetical protein DRN68_04880 [Nitrososphaerota archaeon]